MINPQQRQTILCLLKAGKSRRTISKLLGVSRNSVRKTIEMGDGSLAQPKGPSQELAQLVREQFSNCHGNVVRIHEVLQEEHDQKIAYSSLTRLVRNYDIRGPKRRSGIYVAEPGIEMQHDTSPHQLMLHTQSVKAQCAALIFAFSRKVYIQYYPCYTRFEAKAFLQSALDFMGGSCQQCIIDNTSVILAAGSGADAVITPEMKAFGQQYGFQFIAHAVGHPDRKAHVERVFHYAENNFLAGRTFKSWNDLNEQAIHWCEQIANKKEKRSLGMSPETAYIQEKPYLQALPALKPPVYAHYQRIVDSQGYINLDTNRYSVPEKLIGKTLDIYKYPDTVKIYHQQQSVTQHQRLVGKRNVRCVIKGHHPTLHRQQTKQAITKAEQELSRHSEILDQYIAALKKNVRGRGIRPLNRLLHFKRTYPNDALIAAIQQAHHYRLYDLNRLEDLIIKFVAGNFFNLT
jgi:transposase